VKFVDKDSGNLDFRYASLIMDRFLSFWEPELYRHFKEQGFSHDLYLVQWIMTLFSHTLPYN